MKIKDSLNEIIRRIYKTTIVPEEWDALLQIIGNEFHSPFTVFMDQNIKNGKGLGHFYLGIDDTGVKSYSEYYVPRSILFDEIRHYKPGQAFIDTMCTNYKAYLASETYNDFHKRYNAEHALAVPLNQNNDWMSLLLLRRSLKIGIYTKTELEKLNILTPHLLQASAISRELNYKQLLSVSYEKAFGNLSLGIVLINDLNLVEFINCAAEIYFSENSFLTIKDKKLTAILAKDNQVLQAAIDKTFNLIEGQLIPFSNKVCINDHNNTSACNIYLIPLIDEIQASHSNKKLLLALIIPKEKCFIPEPRLLISLFNLTKKEALLTSMLCQGFTFEQIAKSTCTSLNTVKTHIKNVFQKTETNSQAQLIAKVLSNLELRFLNDN